MITSFILPLLPFLSHSSLSFMFFDFFHFLNCTHSCLSFSFFRSVFRTTPSLSHLFSFIPCHQLSQSFQLMPGNRNEEGRNFCSIFHSVLFPSPLYSFTSSSFLTSSSSFHSLLCSPITISAPIHSKTSANNNCSLST